MDAAATVSKSSDRSHEVRPKFEVDNLRPHLTTAAFEFPPVPQVNLAEPGPSLSDMATGCTGYRGADAEVSDFAFVNFSVSRTDRPSR